METVGIIGGGVIGLCSAWYLQEAGFQVSVLDKGNFTEACSYGNAGMIVPSHFTPLAAPGVIQKGLKWLVNKSSPFSIQPSLDAHFLRWLYLFSRSATQKKVEQAIPHLLAISQWSKRLYKALAASKELDFELGGRGILMQFLKEKTKREEIQLAEKARSLCLEAHYLDQLRLNRLEAGVKYASKGAVYYPGDDHLNPEVFLNTLKKALVQKGVTLYPNEHVVALKHKGKTITARTSNKAEKTFDHYVFCCGAWTTTLLKQLSVYIPVLAGKGYSFSIPNSIGLRQPSLLIDHKLSITPLGNKIRVGGTMELGKTNTKINKAKIKAMVGAIQQYYPDLYPEMPSDATIWSGCRPCSPDGLPFIGQLKGFQNVVVATGHGMLGMSLGPATGKLVSQLIARQRTSIDGKAFDVSRFDKYQI